MPSIEACGRATQPGMSRNNMIKSQAAPLFLTFLNKFNSTPLNDAEIQDKTECQTTDSDEALARCVASGHPARFAAAPGHRLRGALPE